MLKKWRIIWISPTNYVGWGEYCLFKHQADDIVYLMNKDHPDMIHWAQEEY